MALACIALSGAAPVAAYAQSTGGADSTEIVSQAPLVKSPYPVGRCSAPRYPLEALRYELEGTAVVSYRLLPDGRVTDPAVARTTGWDILDQATIDMVLHCAFTAEQGQQANGKLLKMQFSWTLEGDRVRPTRVPDSCPADGRFLTFLEYDRSRSDERGVKVRFLVNKEGKPHHVRLEPVALEATLGADVASFIESCRFTFDPLQRGERTDTVFGTVLMR